MLDQILVCIEGSPSTQRAITLALDIARAQGARLAGLAIIDEPDIRAGAAMGIGGSAYKRDRDQALVEDATRKVHGWLAAFERRCREAGLEARLLEERARPAAAIVEHMPAFNITLIGQDANFMFETTLEDTRTRDTLLHRARKPVIVVPDQPPVASDKVMIAFDGSAASERAVRALAATGVAKQSEVQVVSVDDEGARAWEIASRGVALCRELGIVATPTNVVSPLPVAAALLEARDRIGARLLVMGAYTRSRLAQMLWGSVTRELTQKTPVPLFLHH